MEDLVQMAPLLLVAGAFAGWLSEAISRAGGYGFIIDMAVGIAGSVAAGAIVWALISTGAGMFGMSVIGCVAGGLAIAAQRMLWRSGRPAI